MDIELENEIDLHHFHPGDTASLVGDFIQQAYDKGYEVIRIIHGKGKSVRKKEVLKILQNHSLIRNFYNDRYNWGATIAELINEKPTA